MTFFFLFLFFGRFFFVRAGMMGWLLINLSVLVKCIQQSNLTQSMILYQIFCTVSLNFSIFPALLTWEREREKVFVIVSHKIVIGAAVHSWLFLFWRVHDFHVSTYIYWKFFFILEYWTTLKMKLILSPEFLSFVLWLEWKSYVCLFSKTFVFFLFCLSTAGGI